MRSSSIFPTNTFSAFRLTTSPTSGAIMSSDSVGFGIWTSGILVSPQGALTFTSGAGISSSIIAPTGINYNNRQIIFPASGSLCSNLVLFQPNGVRKLVFGADQSLGAVAISGLGNASDTMLFWSDGSMRFNSAGSTNSFGFGSNGSALYTIDLTSNNVFTSSPNRTNTFSSYIAPGIGACFTFRQTRSPGTNDLLNLVQTGKIVASVTAEGDFKISGTGFFAQSIAISSGAVAGFVLGCLDTSGRAAWQAAPSTSGALTSGAANTLAGLLTINGGVASSIITATTSPYVVTATDYIIEAAFATGTTGTVIFRSGFFSLGQQFVVKDSLGRATNGGIILSGSGITLDGSGSFFMDQDYQSQTLFRNSSGNMNLI